MTKAVYLEWSDASSSGIHGWKERADLDKVGLAKCRSIGWVYRENDEEIVLVAHIDNGPLRSADGELAIPKKWITKRVNLRGIAAMEME